MFDIGMAEMVVIGVVALIVVGPKDLPMMFRRVGQFVGRMRGMAREFQRAMDEAADDSGLRDVADTVRTATTMKNLGLEDAAKSLAKVNEDWNASKSGDDAKDAAQTSQDRKAAVAEANKAAETWPPEGMDDPATAASQQPATPVSADTSAPAPADDDAAPEAGPEAGRTASPPEEPEKTS